MLLAWPPRLRQLPRLAGPRVRVAAYVTCCRTEAEQTAAELLHAGDVEAAASVGAGTAGSRAAHSR